MPTARTLPSAEYRNSPRFHLELRALGLRLRALRKERGWTLDRTADHTGVDLKHIQMIEAGKLNVTMLTLVRLIEGFGVPMERLFVEPGREEEQAVPAG